MSANIYVISDLHFGHKNMALHRGFFSVEEHDAYIVNCWNSVVRKNDVVYILGDLTMEKGDYSILSYLAGFKKVVLGNHDMPQHIPKMLEHVNSVCSSYKLKGCILTHIPIHESEIGRYRYNIHKHVHEKSLDDSRYINVSCEAVGYTPVLCSSLIPCATP